MSDVMDWTTIGADGVSLETLPPFARFVFRGPEGAAQAMSEAFGISLPRDACRASVAADRAALWLGPDEWLLLCPVDGLESIAAEAAERIAQLPHSLVDVSDRQEGLRLFGSRAVTVLSGGNPLDLDLLAFSGGDVHADRAGEGRDRAVADGAREFPHRGLAQLRALRPGLHPRAYAGIRELSRGASPVVIPGLVPGIYPLRRPYSSRAPQRGDARHAAAHDD